MFNRPGGQYANDIVPSYVFGQIEGTSDDIILARQWDAMQTAWSKFNLSDHNDDFNQKADGKRMRRAWFYTGSGLPLHPDGTLDTSGHMTVREVGPVNPAIYRTTLLDLWLGKDQAGREYRCFFLDAAIDWYGKFVELVHEEGTGGVRQNYTLVGEAIPSSLPTIRSAAPWFGMIGQPKGPWWIIDPATGKPSFIKGYNQLWSADWQTQPTYFGVISTEGAAYPYLGPVNNVDPYKTGGGDNLTISNIYRFIIKGGTPVAWNSGFRKIGAAWEYAHGGMLSRQANSPRIFRLARA